MSKYAVRTHMSIADAQIFQVKSNRLRGDNLTRWTSTFLMLTSFYKAYKKGIFNENRLCPVSLAEIEFYIELLLPAYRFTLLHQRNKANIGEVIPSINLLIQKYEQLAKADSKKKPFCQSLINHVKKKFSFELDSNIYAVAAYLDVASIQTWCNKSFASSVIFKARKHLVDVVEEMLFAREESVVASREESVVASNSSPLTSTNVDDNLFANYFDLSDSDSDIPLIKSNKINKIKEETERYHTITTQNPIKYKNATEFWCHHSKEMPLIKELSFILLNIPSSSAFIERFFSVCGIVNRQRAGNMSDSTLINRSFLKTNSNLLEIINE